MQTQYQQLEQYGINLAARQLGCEVLECSDEFFAAADNLINPEPAQLQPEKYVATGKWMDGWESKRRRHGGHDWVILRLGLAGRVETIDVDTSHFQGNAPAAVIIEGCQLPHSDPDAQTQWLPLAGTPAQPISIKPDQHNLIAVPTTAIPITHIRMHILPDGGVARLRVFGQVIPDWSRFLPGELIELSAIEQGGTIQACSDQFFSSPHNLLMPGRAQSMKDGWETRRKRVEKLDATIKGSDSVVIKLGRPGQIASLIIDTSHFRGNYPNQCSVEACYSKQDNPNNSHWTTLLPSTPLRVHCRHRFNTVQTNSEAIFSHIRLNIFPDGGLSRFSVLGYLEQVDV